jgi:glycosyltransferase involved in cell wall biosynthesis
MFKRGNGPLVSFLLPTRNRVHWLLSAIDSVHSLAVDKNCFEFIFKLDDDDKETIQFIDHLSTLIPVKTIISPRGNGYADMHLWVNEMCAMSTGDWLFIFNDDARIMTERWDEVLQYSKLEGYWHDAADDIIALVAPVVSRPGSTEFIFLRRKVYEILGHWALNPHNDTWIMKVMSNIFSIVEIPIYINHFNDESDDLTGKQTKETCKATIPLLIDNKTIIEMLKDSLKLAEYIEEHKAVDFIDN